MIAISGVPEREILRRAAATSTTRVEIMEHANLSDARLVCEMLARDNYDLVCLDSNMTRQCQVVALDAARAANSRPLILLIGSANAPAGEMSRDGLEIDGILSRPLDFDRTRILIDCMVRARRQSRALVVDDSAAVRLIVRKVLQKSRFRIHAEEAEEGVAALADMRRGKFDMVFLDCNMPGIDGFATLAEIKRKHPDTQVIMMADVRDEKTADRALTAGANGFLFKPFYVKEIDAILHDLFGLNAPKLARAS
jgi:DNA-binding NtrC family response regulator